MNRQTQQQEHEQIAWLVPMFACCSARTGIFARILLSALSVATATIILCHHIPCVGCHFWCGGRRAFCFCCRDAWFPPHRAHRTAAVLQALVKFSSSKKDAFWTFLFSLYLEYLLLVHRTHISKLLLPLLCPTRRGFSCKCAATPNANTFRIFIRCFSPKHINLFYYRAYIWRMELKSEMHVNAFNLNHLSHDLRLDLTHWTLKTILVSISKFDIKTLLDSL